MILDPEAFVDLPDGVVLDGSPSDFQVKRFFVQRIGKAEAEDVFARLVIACQQAERWCAINYELFGKAVADSVADIHNGRCGDFSPLVACGRYGLRDGMHYLIDKSLIGYDHDNNIVWITPTGIEHLARQHVPA